MDRPWLASQACERKCQFACSATYLVPPMGMAAADVALELA